MASSSNIHTAMLEIMKQVSYIQKERSKDVNYTLKTENAVIQAIRPAMVEHGVYMYPVGVKDVEHSQFEAGKYKNIWNRIVATHVYRFVHAESDTHIDVEVLGDGADTGDKAGNKSMTTSKKYALLEAFLLETGDDPDTTPSSEMERSVKPAKVTAPGVPSQNGVTPVTDVVEIMGKESVERVVALGIFESTQAAAKTLSRIFPKQRKAPLNKIVEMSRTYRGHRDGGLSSDESVEAVLSGEVL